MTGAHGADAFAILGGVFADIEAESRVALLGIRTVALEAFFGEDGPDIAVELQGAVVRRVCVDADPEKSKEEEPGKHRGGGLTAR